MGELFQLRRGVIPAGDMHDLTQFRNLVRATCELEGVVGYKVGALLGLTYGLPQVVSVVKEYTDLPVIYDHQKAGTDIPQLGQKFARVCAHAGVCGVIIFPQAGPETELAFIAALVAEGLVPMVGGEMTHPRYMAREGGFIRDTAPLEIYQLAAARGVEHFILPGTKPAVMKQYHAVLANLVKEPKYSMPGIGRQGGEIPAAFGAVGAAPAYAIIGASIYEQADMRSAAQRYCDEAMSTIGGT